MKTGIVWFFAFALVGCAHQEPWQRELNEQMKVCNVRAAGATTDEQVQQLARWCATRINYIKNHHEVPPPSYPYGYVVAEQVLRVLKPGIGPYVPPNVSDYVRAYRQYKVVQMYAQPVQDLPANDRVRQSLKAGCIPCTPPCKPVCQ